MVANAIGWWINNASDRYVIIYFLGMSANGIYSVAGKIPAILNILQTIFAQAWSLSVVKEFDAEDSNLFFTNTYVIYNCFMTIGCSGLILFDKIVSKFLYAKDFYVAWRYVPFLTIAIVFGSLSGYIGGFFSATKNTKIYGQSTIWGAIANIVLNLILVPLFGAIGAAIATCISYFVIWVFRLFHSKKLIKLRVNFKKNCISYVLLLIQTFLLFIIDGIWLYCLETFLFFIILFIHGSQLLLILKIKKEQTSDWKVIFK